MSNLPPPLPLDDEFQLGFMAGVPSVEAARQTAKLALDLGYDSVWTGDHVAFPVPILDPLIQLAVVCAFAPSITVGTAIYLLPLRHPVPLAKQVTTLDHVSGGRFIFGVGIGGEFPDEYAACGVPLHERGARLSESIGLLRELFRGEEVQRDGRFYPIPKTRMLPPPVQHGGPPIWCGGRSDATMRRLGRMGDGWISYVVTPERYAQSLEEIAAEAEAVHRPVERFGTGHLLFTYVADDYETALDVATAYLSQRYNMDFRDAARKYAALGRPEDVAAKMEAFRDAGVRHLLIDVVGPAREHSSQLERIAREVRPLLAQA